MFIHSLGKRFKNFFRIKIFSIKRKKNYAAPGNDDENTKTWFYENGSVKAVCRYRNGMLHGISVHYYENGNVKLKETYKNGILDGMTKLYDGEGKLLKEKYFKRGELVKEKFYGIKDNLSE